MSAQVRTTVVSRVSRVGSVDGGLALVLARPWPWLAAAAALPFLAAAQAGLDDGFLTSVAMAVALGLTIRLPRVAAVIAVFASVGWLFPQAQPIPVAAGAGLVIVCGVAAYRLTLLDCCVLGALFLVNAVTPFTADGPGAAGYLTLVVVLAALGFGRLVRSHVAVVAEHRALADVHASTVREHLLLADRTAIAHELHDVVAHHISRIAIQTETARYTTPGLPDLADARLAAIGDSARDALVEMRRILAVIRSPAAPGAGAGSGRRPEAVLAPAPGLDQLPALVAASRALGTAVELDVSGPPVALPGDIDLVAYRVIQEALTNARRHAPTASVEVSVRYAPGVLRLAVRDGGPGLTPAPAPDRAPGVAGGLGLIGMRERVDAVGGTLRHGSGPRGGFEVVARLPLRPGR
jgi:signal transduction histidine kinase